MTINELLANVLPEINKELRNINAGGCLMFGYALKLELAKHGIESDMVLVDYGYSDLDEILFLNVTHQDNISDALEASFENNTIAERFRPYYCFGHVACRVRGELFDSTGSISDHLEAISDPIRPRVCEELLHMDVWNHMFKVSNPNNHHIQTTINKFLSKVLKEV